MHENIISTVNNLSPVYNTRVTHKSVRTWCALLLTVILVYDVLFSLLKTLLDLGSSANYKDKSGLTPLYVCVVNDEVLAASQRCVDMLLYDHTTLGIRNSFGWTELHQVPSFSLCPIIVIIIIIVITERGVAVKP